MGVKPSVEITDDDRANRLYRIEQQAGNKSEALREAIDMRGDSWFLEQAEKLELEPKELWERMKENFGDGYTLVPKEEASEIMVRRREYESLQGLHGQPIDPNREDHWPSIVRERNKYRIPVIEGHLLYQVVNEQKKRFSEDEIAEVIRRAGFTQDERGVKRYIDTMVAQEILVASPSHDTAMKRYEERARVNALDTDLSKEVDSLEDATRKQREKYSLENVMYRTYSKYQSESGYYISRDVYVMDCLDILAEMLNKQASFAPTSDDRYQLSGDRPAKMTKKAVSKANHTVINGIITCLENRTALSDDVITSMRNVAVMAHRKNPEWVDEWVEARTTAEDYIENPMQSEDEKQAEKMLRDGMDAATARRQLGVGKDADEEEVKSAFREKAKETHPDVSDSPDERKFKLIVAARDALLV